jgi:hypothetical protein
MDRGSSRRLIGSMLSCIVWALSLLCCAPPDAGARVTTLTITSAQSAFGGARFGSVGTYEVITGTFTDEVDPVDPHNTRSSISASARKTQWDCELYRRFSDHQTDRPVQIGASGHL